MARLLEGVATGVEGAFDVGPPAARRMSLPDVRRFSPAASATVTECLLEIQAENLMPPAPTRDGHVVRLRRQLDTSILVHSG